MLDLRRLRYFVSIVEAGSISAASRQLGVAQPALSHHMGELERIVGLPLLERSARGVRVTRHGAVLFEHSRGIVDQVETAERVMRRLAQDKIEPRIVKLALIPSWSTTFTPAIVQAIRERMPHITLQLFEARNEEARRIIDAGEADLAVMLSPGANPADELIVRETLYLVSSQPMPERSPFSSLSREKIILPSAANPLRHTIEAAAEQAGILLQSSMEIDGHDTVKRAVQAGLGVSILAWNSVSSECASGLLRASRIVEPEIYRSVFLRRSAATGDATFHFFRDLLREIVLAAPATGIAEP